MKRFFRKLWARFLTGFGNIKVFGFPMFAVYDPDFFKMTGEKILEAAKILDPGDIILRGYDHYLDSAFIPDKYGFSHGAVYINNNIVIHAVAEGVSKINVVDFCECDRLAILRPKKGVKKAVMTAIECADRNVPYDFFFENGCSALYCFELCRKCYPGLDIRTKTVKKLLGLVRKDVYLAESFFDSPDFECVFHYNPKYHVDFVRSS